jgi:hypothetical protein
MKYLVFFLSLIMALSFSSCGGGKKSVASGTAKRERSREDKNSFSAKKRKSSRPPQMGFYAKSEKKGFFRATSYKVKRVFSSKEKQHVLDNDERATSAKNNKRKQKSAGQQTEKFAKGKGNTKKGGKNKQGDHTSDAFSKNMNKKGFLGIFKKKK